MDAYAKPPLQGKLAFRQGAIYGVGLGVIGIIIALIALAVPGVSFVSWIVNIIGFILVGVFSAQKTGRVATGTVAGLWAGLISGVISLIWGIINIFTISSARYAQLANQVNQASGNTQALQSAIIIGAVIILIVGLGADLGIGAGLGAIGGLIGKNRAPAAPAAEYQEAPYPGASPYASAPQQPAVSDNPYQGAANPYATPGVEPTVQANPYQGSANPQSTPAQDQNPYQQP